MASLYLIEVSNSHPSRRRKPSPWCPCPCRYRASRSGFAQAVWGLALAAREPGCGSGDLCSVVADGFRPVTVGYGAVPRCARCRQRSAPVPARTAPGRAAPAPVPGRTVSVPWRTASAHGRTAPAYGRIVPAHGRTASAHGRTVPAHGRTVSASRRAVRPCPAGVARGGAGTRGVGEQGPQQQERALFGERLVPGAAFGRLDAGRAPRLALATGN